MKLNELSSNSGCRKKKKRVGRGIGSGNGTTAGRGHKGYNSRSGGGVRVGFEGGQMPLHRRLPKRGFRNVFKKKYEILNLVDISKISFEKVIDRKVLLKLGIIKSSRKKIKLLGQGNVNSSFRIIVDKASKSAMEKVKSAGGMVEGVI